MEDRKENKGRAKSPLIPHPWWHWGVCPSSCGRPIYFFHFKCFPFNAHICSRPSALLSDFSHMHFLPSLASRQLQAEQFWTLPRGNENGWRCVPAWGPWSLGRQAVLSSVTFQPSNITLQSYRMPDGVTVISSFLPPGFQATHKRKRQICPPSLTPV